MRTPATINGDIKKIDFELSKSKIIKQDEYLISLVSMISSLIHGYEHYPSFISMMVMENQGTLGTDWIELDDLSFSVFWKL